MKTLLSVSIVILFTLEFVSSIQAQSTQSGLLNVGHDPNPNNPFTHYLGWQNNDLHLYFRTGFHGGVRNRMLIRKGGFGNNTGRIAMGNNLPNNFIPRSRLHLHQRGGVTDIRFTNNGTGSLANDGLQVGIAGGGSAWFRLWENRDMLFYTNNILRMKIFRGNNNTTQGRILISNNIPTGYTPQARLHLLQFGNGNNGNMFRSDGKYNSVNQWEMYTGTNVNNVTLKGRFYTSPNTVTQVGGFNMPTVTNQPYNHFVMEAPEGDLVFRVRGTSQNTGEILRMSAYPYVHTNGFTLQRYRIGLSTDGMPITNPLAALHIGTDWYYNLGGHRKWMDIGVFMNDESDQMYVGLRANEFYTQDPDRKDAVISWSDNPTNTSGDQAPDVLRVIFTAPYSGGASSATARHLNGLEAMRFQPIADNADPNNSSNVQVGIGDFSYNGVNPPGSPTYIDAKLDIDGDLRIRNITQNDSLNMVLVADPNDLNRVHWRDASTLGGNGWGNFCGATQNALTADWEIPLDNYGYSFTTTQPKGRVNVGNLTCNNFAPARLTSSINTIMDSTVKEHTAILGFANGTNFLDFTSQYGVWGIVTKAASFESAGVYGKSISPQNLLGSTTMGIGVKGAAEGATINIGVYGYAFDVNASQNIGGYFSANYGTNNYAIYATAPASGNNPPTGPNYAGYFAGDVLVTGSALVQNSDSLIKQNIQPITNGLSIIKQLKPRSYEYITSGQYASLNLQSGTHYGFIAQDVEQVLPDIVTQTVHPAQYDSLGNQISPSFTLKGLRYTELLPYLIAGIKEQQQQIDSLAQASTQKDSLLNNVLARLTILENCVNNANICSYNTRTSDNSTTDFENSVALQDVPAIILDQNVPNPFAENTVITFTIPDNIQQAQLVFYNTEGKVIKQMEIVERGKGKLQVYGENLSNGIYTYALIADGKIIATKQMVKTE